ncbi:MAG: hypothetical protein Q8K20_14020 [Gemmobacter sp.]|nr:hypothetical protein [Gemmobacter sp.]
MTAWIDELERDLGQAARLRLIASAGGQRRDIPKPAHAAASKLAGEVGADVAVWLAERFGGEKLDFPSARGRELERRAALLRAAILDAGLTNPSRSANDLATEHGVSSMWVRKQRAQMRRERDREPFLPLFD